MELSEIMSTTPKLHPILVSKKYHDNLICDEKYDFFPKLIQQVVSPKCVHVKFKSTARARNVHTNTYGYKLCGNPFPLSTGCSRTLGNYSINIFFPFLGPSQFPRVHVFIHFNENILADYKCPAQLQLLIACN